MNWAEEGLLSRIGQMHFEFHNLLPGQLEKILETMAEHDFEVIRRTHPFEYLGVTLLEFAFARPCASAAGQGQVHDAYCK
jgi:hypothetical protein